VIESELRYAVAYVLAGTAKVAAQLPGRSASMRLGVRGVADQDVGELGQHIEVG
jgi:hypothetical protein